MVEYDKIPLSDRDIRMKTRQLNQLDMMIEDAKEQVELLEKDLETKRSEKRIRNKIGELKNNIEDWELNLKCLQKEVREKAQEVVKPIAKKE